MDGKCEPSATQAHGVMLLGLAPPVVGCLQDNGLLFMWIVNSKYHLAMDM